MAINVPSLLLYNQFLEHYFLKKKKKKVFGALNEHLPDRYHTKSVSLEEFAFPKLL